MFLDHPAHGRGDERVPGREPRLFGERTGLDHGAAGTLRTVSTSRLRLISDLPGLVAVFDVHRHLPGHDDPRATTHRKRRGMVARVRNALTGMLIASFGAARRRAPLATTCCAATGTSTARSRSRRRAWRSLYYQAQGLAPRSWPRSPRVMAECAAASSRSTRCAAWRRSWSSSITSTAAMGEDFAWLPAWFRHRVPRRACGASTSSSCSADTSSPSARNASYRVFAVSARSPRGVAYGSTRPTWRRSSWRWAWPRSPADCFRTRRIRCQRRGADRARLLPARDSRLPARGVDLLVALLRSADVLVLRAAHVRLHGDRAVRSIRFRVDDVGAVRRRLASALRSVVGGALRDRWPQRSRSRHPVLVPVLPGRSRALDARRKRAADPGSLVCRRRRRGRLPPGGG